MSLSATALATLFTKILAAFVSYGFIVMMARLMTPAGFGQLVFFLNLSVMLSVIGACGQHLALIRFIPTLNSAAALRHLRGVAFRLAAKGTVLTVVLATVVVVLIKNLGGMSGYSSAAILFGLALVFAVGWADFQAHRARGQQMIQLSLIPKELLWRAAAALFVGVIWFTGYDDPIPAELILFVLLACLICVTALQNLVLRRLEVAPGRTPAGTDVNTTWRQTIGPFWITSISNLFLANADVIVVGLLLGPEAAGYYFAANRLALLLGFFSTSFNLVIAPRLAKTWRVGRPGAAHRIVRDATLWMTVPTFGLGLLLIIFAAPALTLFGAEYVQAAPALKILLIAAMLNAAGGPADIALNMCGFERAAMRASAKSLGLNALLLLGGALAGSIVTVACAVLIGTVLRKSLFWAAARREMGLRTDVLAALGWHNLPPIIAGR